MFTMSYKCYPKQQIYLDTEKRLIRVSSCPQEPRRYEKYLLFGSWDFVDFMTSKLFPLWKTHWFPIPSQAIAHFLDHVMVIVEGGQLFSLGIKETTAPGFSKDLLGTSSPKNI